MNRRAEGEIQFLSEHAIDLLRDAPCGVAVTDADGRLLFVNETLARWAGRSVPESVGALSLRNLLTRPGQLYYETHIAPMMRIQGFVREISCHVDAMGREPVPVLLSGAARRDTEGRIQRIDYTIFDARERHNYEEALRNARAEAEELAAIVRASPDAILRIDPDGIVKSWNAAAESLLGWPAGEAIGKKVSDAVPLSDFPEWLAPENGNSAGEGHEVREVTHADGRDLEITLARIGALHPTIPADYTVIMRDISLRKQLERHRETVLQEMNHRIKNSLSVVSGIARQTLPAEAAGGFIARIRSLSKAHDALAATHSGTIDLRQLLEFAAVQAGGPNRLTFDGPLVELSSRQATSLSMVFHELVTNALKYGALYGSDGQVRIEYKLVDGALWLDWRESGGPPVPQPPQEGFGTRMIKLLLTSDLQAETRFDFHPDGLIMSMRLPLISG